MNQLRFGERLARLETAVGLDAANGLRGDIAEIKREVRTLFGLVRGIEKRIYVAMGGACVLIWILDRFWPR